MEWKSKINGKHLRALIKEGESFKILQELEYLLKRIKSAPNRFKLDEYELEEFSDLLYTVESDTYLGEQELLKYINGEDWLESIQEVVDDRLSQFYDLCDGNRIWLTV